MWKDSCGYFGKECEQCWAKDSGTYEDDAVQEYFSNLSEAETEYYESIKEYTDGNW